MPLSRRGREVFDRLPTARARSGGSIGCEIVRHEDLCIGCGRCASGCPTGATRAGDTFNVHQLLSAPAGSRRGDLGALLRRLMRVEPAEPVRVPPRVTTLRTVLFDEERCIGCGTCVRGCPAGAIEARPPRTATAAAETAS